MPRTWRVYNSQAQSQDGPCRQGLRQWATESCWSAGTKLRSTKSRDVLCQPQGTRAVKTVDLALSVPIINKRIYKNPNTGGTDSLTRLERKPGAEADRVSARLGARANHGERGPYLTPLTTTEGERARTPEAAAHSRGNAGLLTGEGKQPVLTPPQAQPRRRSRAEDATAWEPGRGGSQTEAERRPETDASGTQRANLHDPQDTDQHRP